MKRLSGNEIRSMWLEFFKSKGHSIERSASLVPLDDKSLLWMNAGVTPLKKYFDGRKTPDNPRICNAQKCIRTNDIENVGKTSRHHTFFEMLGNFSIGDYFRDDVIPWAVELLTSDKWFGLDKSNLYMTYYPTDKDTYNKWIESGIDESHLVPCEGNFWEIGEGPCGPDTEIFYDRGPKYGNFTKDAIENDIENDRFIEIWNIVFSQFNSDGSGKRETYKQLPKKNIDTGSGLERLACIFQDAETNFDTDLFMPMINEVSKLTNVEYKGQESFKIISDHLRTITFAVSDGALFSNEGRGYVLRRLLRRAVKHGMSLGLKEPFLYKLVDIVVLNMKGFYPNLETSKELVKKLIYQEEVKFLNTIDSGLEKLNEIILKSDKEIKGKDLFLLFDTYGFPVELTEEYALEKGLTVDKNGYNKEMEEQKQRARNAMKNGSSFSKQRQDYLEFKDESIFTGYESLEEDAQIIKVFDEGFVTDKTPFYALCGGQKGDTGTVTFNSIDYEILDTLTLPNKQHLHIVSDSSLFNTGDKVHLSVNIDRRSDLTKNHSCCHLMFKALRETLGSHVSQQGSEISPETLRFDFNHFESLKDEEILKIEELTNNYINKGYDQVTNEVPLTEVEKLGAIAEFGEKYSDLVRVVNLGATVDVCGGTHVKNTKDIGKFMVQSISSIGSGIYRVVGLTEPQEALEDNYFKGFNEEMEKLMNKANDLLNKAHENNIDIKFDYKNNFKYEFSYKDVLNIRLELNKLQNAVKALDKELSRKLDEKKSSSFSDYNKFINEKGGVLLLENYDRGSLRPLIDYLSSLNDNSVVAIVDKVDSKLQVLVKSRNANIDASKLLKDSLLIADGKGGGKNDFAQGGAPSDIKASEVYNFLKENI